MNRADILTRILATKVEEIARDSAQVPLDELRRQAMNMAACRGFYNAVRKQIEAGNNAIIAEAKKASPSKGVIRERFDIEQIAISYQQSGATCLSVLTDQDYFQGNLANLAKAHAVVDLPLLRKDFIIDEYQVYQARVAKADCILLIVSALTHAQLHSLSACAQQIGLDVLVEVHDAKELEQALSLENVLLGINNRNLRTFETDLNTTIALLPLIGKDRIVVTESGINNPADIKLMNTHNVRAFLIGEAFMSAESPGEKLKSLFA